MTDIYVCIALMAFGFAVLGFAWIFIDGIAAYQNWKKHIRYNGKHEKPRNKRFL